MLQKYFFQPSSDIILRLININIYLFALKQYLFKKYEEKSKVETLKVGFSLLKGCEKSVQSQSLLIYEWKTELTHIVGAALKLKRD